MAPISSAGTTVPTPPRISGSLFSDRGKICMRALGVEWAPRSRRGSATRTRRTAESGTMGLQAGALIERVCQDVQALVLPQLRETFSGPVTSFLQPVGRRAGSPL